MESEFPNRIPWEEQYYSDNTILGSPKSIKCKMCETTFLDEKITIPYRIKHLNEKHYITELTDHPERGFLQHKFVINTAESTAKCFTCKRVIYYNKYGLYLLKNHLEIYHGNSSYIYEKIAKTKIGCDTLNKYFIMGSEATCLKCEQKIGEESLKELLKHYFSHRYEDKCFKFAKMRKSILFYLFCFNNFIIIRYQRHYDRNQFLIKIVNYCYRYKSFVIM